LAAEGKRNERERERERRKKGRSGQVQWLMPVIPATQEDWGSKPAWANSYQAPISKKNPEQNGLGRSSCFANAKP
jgi:hypothetical protein